CPEASLPEVHQVGAHQLQIRRSVAAPRLRAEANEPREVGAVRRKRVLGETALDSKVRKVEIDLGLEPHPESLPRRGGRAENPGAVAWLAQPGAVAVAAAFLACAAARQRSSVRSAAPDDRISRTRSVAAFGDRSSATTSAAAAFSTNPFAARCGSPRSTESM